jgi:hypothetical protein
MDLGRLISALRRRFAAVFVIGLALSIASFVEGLRLVQDIASYVMHALERMTGIYDILIIMANSLHIVLEWWRDLVRALLAFIHLPIPQWLHDPLSAAFFGMSRGVNRWLDERDRALGYLDAATLDAERQRAEAEERRRARERQRRDAEERRRARRIWKRRQEVS